MKHLFLSLIALLSLSQAMMAETPYMVREGQQWVYEIDNFFSKNGQHEDHIFSMTLEFKGDTVIDGMTYLKLYRTLAEDVRGLSGNTVGDTVTIIPKGTELIASLREDEIHGVYAIYEIPYRMQVRNFTTNNFRYNMAEDDPLLFGNYEYNIYHLGSIDNSTNPSEWYLMNVRLNEYSEQGYFKFVKQQRFDSEHLPFGINVWCDGNGEMSPMGHFFFHQFFGYYKESSSSVGFATFISPLGTLRDFRAHVSCRFSHLNRDGNTIYKTSAYNQDLDTTVGVNQIVTDGTEDDAYWYDLNGRAIAMSRPAQPGIYIHQGRKVVVK